MKDRTIYWDPLVEMPPGEKLRDLQLRKLRLGVSKLPLLQKALQKSWV